MAQPKTSGLLAGDVVPFDVVSHQALVPAAGATAAWLDPQGKYFGTPAQLVHVNGELTGRFPVWVTRWRYGLPLSVLTTWHNPLTFSGIPYIREDLAEQTLEAFLGQSDVSAFLLKAVPAEGPFWDTLQRSARRAGAPFEKVAQWQRAALCCTGSFETWFENNFERKRRKEFRRLKSRLAETGHVEFRKLARSDNVQDWLHAHLELEVRGWKGRTGTALLADPRTVNCLEESLTALHAEGKLKYWSLTHDGHPLAMMFAVIEAPQAWLAKITFDEAFAKFSPGVLLLLNATEDLFAERAIELADSCAIPHHPMIDNIWRDRLAMCDVLIGKPGMSETAFAMLRTAEMTRRHGREALKSIYYRLKRKHRS
jgi:hypothetical protein